VKVVVQKANHIHRRPPNKAEPRFRTLLVPVPWLLLEDDDDEPDERPPVDILALVTSTSSYSNMSYCNRVWYISTTTFTGSWSNSIMTVAWEEGGAAISKSESIAESPDE